MEAIKLPAPSLSIVPDYDYGQLILQLGRARRDNQLLRDKNTVLAATNKAQTLEIERLKIELAREQDHVSRLQVMSVTASLIPRNPKMSLKDITALVCVYLGIREELLKTKSRKAPFVYARALCFYLSDRYGNPDTVQMGKYFGRDHSTAINGRDDIRDKVTIYEDVAQDVANLSAEIENILNP